MSLVLESQQGRPSRLVDARAEFAASLGRRLQALKAALTALEAEPHSAARRDHLLRRVHAMGASARVLGFASVAEALVQAEAALHSGSQADAHPAQLHEIARALEVIPGLVSGAVIARQPAPRTAERLETERVAPMTVIVFGAATLADALCADAASELEVERCEELETALELVRGAGPDAVVVDCDASGGHELATALFDDPLLLRTPVLVVGEFGQAPRAAEYVARGAARVLVKPVSPETLHAAVLQAVSSRAARSETSELGELDVEGLAERIASEIRRGLVDAAAPAARGTTVNLGSGSEVLGAVWGAVARVREIVTLRSGGSLRFAQTGPEGAIPLGSWHTRDVHGGPRAKPPSRREEVVGLQGRRIVVVDDDPAVAWFISGVLRAVGAEVLELHDGERARTLILETWPDAVITDVLMPGLDGFALCRELKRDVVVRDVPVILLSWKEDLLQRLREIGADADGYLRKEASASTVVERVREVLAPRARVEQRLRAGGEVRGRLDGLTPRLVLELATAHAPDCRVSVRDAAYLYDLQIRGGRPCCATRTSADGRFERGRAVLGPLLGVSAGRFVITQESGPCRSDFEAPLHELLAEPVQLARAAQQAFSGGQLAHVEAVELDADALRAYRMPGVAEVQALIERLSEGASPRELLLSGSVAPALLESILLDLARHGAVRAVFGARGRSALQAEADVPTFDPQKRAEYTTQTPPPPGFTLLLSPQPEAVDGAGAEGADALFAGVTAFPTALSEPPHPVFTPSPLGITALVALAEQRALDAASEPAPEPSAPPLDADSAEPLDVACARADSAPTPSPQVEAAPNMDLADAVLDTLSEASLPPPLVEAHPQRAEADVASPGVSQADLVSASPDLPNAVEAESPPVATPRSGHPLAAAALDAASPSPQSASPGAVENTTARLAPAQEDAAPAAALRVAPLRAAFDKPVVEARAASSTSPVRIALITLGAAALSYGIVRYGISPQLTGAAQSQAAQTSAAATPTDSHMGAARPASAEPALPEAVRGPAAASPGVAAAPKPEDLPLPPGVIIAQDKGLLEIDTSDKHAIYVDGVFVGRGPLRRIPLAPGSHRVELRDGAEKNGFSVDIRRGRRAQVSVGGDEKPGARR